MNSPKNSLQRTPPTPVIGVGTLNISARAKQKVMEALNSNRLSYGPMMQRLEREFAQLHGCRFGVMSNSGTGALQIALQAMKELHGWQDGDEVLIPAVTFVATANVVLMNRMTPVLVDVESTYYAMDASLIEARITARTRAIIPVHLFGHPADMDPILEIARRHKLQIIEDSCETMFASYKGRRVGSLGDIGCFSTYVAHLLVTGVGGLNTTNNPDYAVRLHSLLNHGRDSIYLSIDDDKNKKTEELNLIIARRFKFVSVGHSFRSTEMEAALGLAQLEEWEPMIAARRTNASSLTRQLSHLNAHLQLPSIRPGSEHSFMMYPILLRDEPKENLVRFLEEHGVGTREMLPLTNQPVHQSLLGWNEKDWPVARMINERGFYIGCHQDLSEIDLEYMVELFERYYRHQTATNESSAALVLLTKNSAPVLETLMDQVPFDLFEKVVAIDQGSTDSTLDALKKQGIDVKSESSQGWLRMLKGDALGLSQNQIVIFPLDGRHNANDIGRILLTLRRGYDMVVASRFLPGSSRQHQTLNVRYRSAGNRVFTTVANLLFYGNLTDTLETFRAFQKRRFEEATIENDGLAGLYQLSIQNMKRGWKSAEISTVEMINPFAADWARAALSIFPITWTLLKEWWRGKNLSAEK